MTKHLFPALAWLLQVACTDAHSTTSAPSSGDAAGTKADAPIAASRATTAVRVDVGYAVGAAPHTEAGLTGRSPFDLSQVNLERLFAGRTVSIPRTLAAMREIPDVPAGPYTSGAILTIAAAQRPAAPNESTDTVYVLWLDGFYMDDSGEKDQVLGVSLGHTGVIAMFKPVIEGAAGILPTNSAAYIEQSTLVHEVGHAAGLVHNGLALTSEHQDPEHAAHCNNSACIMYWQNEGSEGLSDFLARNGGDGASVLFGAECLADIDAAKP